MVIDRVLAMETGARLTDAIRKASERKISQSELMEQRVSFVFGSMDNQNGVTKEQVRQAILEQVGSSGVAHQ